MYVDAIVVVTVRYNDRSDATVAQIGRGLTMSVSPCSASFRRSNCVISLNQICSQLLAVCTIIASKRSQRHIRRLNMAELILCNFVNTLLILHAFISSTHLWRMFSVHNLWIDLKFNKICIHVYFICIHVIRPIPLSLSDAVRPTKPLFTTRFYIVIFKDNISSRITV